MLLAGAMQFKYIVPQHLHFGETRVDGGRSQPLEDVRKLLFLKMMHTNHTNCHHWDHLSSSSMLNAAMLLASYHCNLAAFSPIKCADLLASGRIVLPQSTGIASRT